MHSCSKPSQPGAAHKVLPVHTHQASQHHWDEAKPSTQQWKPAGVCVHRQVGGWQHSWPSLEQPSAALPQAGSLLTMGSPPATRLNTAVPLWCKDTAKQEENPW